MKELLLSFGCGLLIGASLCAQKPPALPPDATPKEVRDLIRNTAEDLSNKDSRSFLERFDGKMPDFQTFDYDIEALAARGQILSTIEIVKDEAAADSDGQQRTLLLDWLLTVDAERSRRQIVKVTIQKQGKKWKFIALDPIDFFKPPA